MGRDRCLASVRPVLYSMGLVKPNLSLDPGSDPSQNGAASGAQPSVDGAALVLPAHSTRGSAPGPRGCWALNSKGEPCGAAKRGDGDYCNAHSGVGVARDPRAFVPQATAAAARVRAERAQLRVLLGSTRTDTPRGVLRAKAFLHSERLAARALDAALDPDVDSLRAGQLALSIIKEADPAEKGQLVLSQELTPQGVDNLSLSELIAVAERLQLSPPETA